MHIMDQTTMKKRASPGLPPWPKRPVKLTSSSAMPPSVLPLAPSSFQVWTKPYSMNMNSSCNSVINDSPFNLSDVVTTIPSSSLNNNSKNNIYPSSSSSSAKKDDKNPSIQNLITPDRTGETDQAVTASVRIRAGRPIDPNMDPKRLRRVISNRVSAQRSRRNKLQYLIDIEKKVKDLETEIAVLLPQVSMYISHHQALQMEHKRLNMEISAHTCNKMLKDAEIEENKAEVSRLRLLHLTQQKRLTVAAWENRSHPDQHMVNPNNIFQFSLQQMASMTSNQAKNGESTEAMDKQHGLNMKKQSGEERCILGWDRRHDQQEIANPSLHQPASSSRQGQPNRYQHLGGIEQVLTFNFEPIDPDRHH